jgi:hypothetical protein
MSYPDIIIAASGSKSSFAVRLEVCRVDWAGGIVPIDDQRCALHLGCPAQYMGVQGEIDCTGNRGCSFDASILWRLTAGWLQVEAARNARLAKVSLEAQFGIDYGRCWIIDAECEQAIDGRASQAPVVVRLLGGTEAGERGDRIVFQGFQAGCFLVD